MIDAILARAIPIVPIVEGNLPFFERFFNSKRVILCQFPRQVRNAELAFNQSDVEMRVRWMQASFSEQLRRCVNKVQQVDQNDELYSDIVSQPFLKGNKLAGSLFDINLVGRSLRKLLQAHKSYLISESDAKELASTSLNSTDLLPIEIEPHNNASAIRS